MTDPTSRSYQVILERDPDDEVWVTFIPALDFLSTFGESRGEALAMTREAIEGYIDAARKEGIELPADSHVAELVRVEVSAR